MNEQIIYNFVDNSLKELVELDMAKLPHDNMPAEMVDHSRQPIDDWVPWKAVRSTVTDADLIEIETLAGKEFPGSYKAFLKYKHFYELPGPNPMEVVFFRHPICDWKAEYIQYYNYEWVREGLLAKGYVPFADHEDWGILCFDTHRNAATKEYPIIMIDHELVYNDPTPFEEFADNFIDMIRKRLT